MIENWVRHHAKDKAAASQFFSANSTREVQIAEQIFKVWDKKLLRYIMQEDFAENMIALGLAPDSNAVRKIMICLKGVDANFPDQLSEKEFCRLFEHNRFGTRANAKICEEYKETYAEFTHQQFIRIIGSVVKAEQEKANKRNQRGKRGVTQRTTGESTFKETFKALEANNDKQEMQTLIKQFVD